ncbi:hypothetical protein [Streptacidiphilus pinicola]|uniref:hypothetical protein n=1 Tax=Streptacidiphilus pinicola TaxID=2219663 RepID=UPI00140339E2|nr:hypothetical protein [Streptacidiphilus pinicola]
MGRWVGSGLGWTGGVVCAALGVADGGVTPTGTGTATLGPGLGRAALSPALGLAAPSGPSLG